LLVGRWLSTHTPLLLLQLLPRRIVVPLDPLPLLLTNFFHRNRLGLIIGFAVLLEALRDSIKLLVGTPRHAAVDIVALQTLVVDPLAFGVLYVDAGGHLLLAGNDAVDEILAGGERAQCLRRQQQEEEE
jgi:hypothetical protein